MGGGEYSSSGEEDGDAEWRAAINSVVSTNTTTTTTTTTTTSSTNRENNADIKTIKLYQIKAQKLLDDILEKSLQVVKQKPNDEVTETINGGGGGVRLFRDAPVGILFDQHDEFQGPLKRPRIIPNVEVHEKSKKFKQQVKSVAVDGNDIMVLAKEAHEKALAKVAARDAAAKAKAKKEEERVAELKKIRGERWLPAIAREMRLKPSTK